jgi:hypothetical protein
VDANESHLRYFAASCVTTPMGNLNDVTLVSPTNGEVGKLDGMIIDPWERHVCYFVVESWRGYRTRRYLLPATPARIDANGKALRVDVEPEDLRALPQLDPELFPSMSVDDLIEALFSPRDDSRPLPS